MHNIPEVDLTTLGRGAALELFNRELQRVLANIKDVNTNPNKNRKITLEFDFKPYMDRSGAACDIKVSSKICATNGVNATIYISRVAGGGFQAFTQDTQQAQLGFEEEDDSPSTPARPLSRTAN